MHQVYQVKIRLLILTQCLTDPVFDRFPEPPPTYDGKSNTTTQNQTVLPHANAQVAEPSVPVTRTESSFSNCRASECRGRTICPCIFVLLLFLAPTVFYFVL